MEEVNNARIAKNTIMLYFRMILVMCVGLYTSRVVLQTLGASDYGVYNLVGGFVSMLAYLNSVFVGATQRFLSFSLGKGDQNDLAEVFRTSVRTHQYLALLILLVAESFGIWFINNQLNIEADRLFAAHCVYQCSLVSLFITVISVPYNACIVAHEHMHIYAYVSVLDALLKLLIVFFLVYSPFDHLITYAVLQVVVSITIRLCYTIYCKRTFVECKAHSFFSRVKFKEMVSYASWVLVGNLGFSFKDQFSNIILNQFFGTVVNASRGIAGQVSGMVCSFAQNFFMAMSPQITKQYAAGNIEESRRLVFAASKYTFYLLLLISVPAILNMRYLLRLWLVDVPIYTYEFIIITLVSTLLGSLANATTTALQATGRIKTFQVGISIIMLSELPIAYCILRLGYPAPVALMPAIITNTVGVIFRYILLNRYVPGYDYTVFISIIFKCLLVGILCWASCWIACRNLPESFLCLFVSVAICVVICSILIVFIGMSASEREYILHVISSKIKK